MKREKMQVGLSALSERRSWSKLQLSKPNAEEASLPQQKFALTGKI